MERGAASLVINVSVPLSWPCVCVCVCRNNGITARLQRNGYGRWNRGSGGSGGRVVEGVCGRDWKSKQEPQTAPDASTTQIDANICISTQDCAVGKGEVQKENAGGNSKRTWGYMTIINMTQAHTPEMSPAMQHSNAHTHTHVSLIRSNHRELGKGGSLTYHLIPYNTIVQFDGFASRESINSSICSSITAQQH